MGDDVDELSEEASDEVEEVSEAGGDVNELSEDELLVVDEVRGVAEELPEGEEALVVDEVLETVDELPSVEDAVLVELEEATEELDATVQFAMGIDITLTPDPVPLFDTSTSVQASVRKICVFCVMALSGWLRVKVAV